MGAGVTGASPFSALPLFSYDLIMADPPWPFELRSPKGEAKSYAAHYGAMDMAAIAKLPVGHLAARDCVLFLWCTWPMLPRGLDTIAAWGFDYRTGGAWHKRTVTGKTAFGTGFRVRSASEPFLLAVNGAPDTSRAERNLIEGLAREHSRKPEEAFAWCERYLPGARRLELFSRQHRPGWDSWGLEAGKFDPVVSVSPATNEDEKSYVPLPNPPPQAGEGEGEAA